MLRPIMLSIKSHYIIRFIAHPNDSHQYRKYLHWKHICQHQSLNIDSQYEWYHITNSYSIHEIIYILLFHQSNISIFRKLIYSINIHSIQFFFNQSFIIIHMSFIWCPFIIDSNISFEYEIWGSIIEWIGSISNDFNMVTQKCSNESRNITSSTLYNLQQSFHDLIKL